MIKIVNSLNLLKVAFGLDFLKRLASDGEQSGIVNIDNESILNFVNEEEEFENKLKEEKESKEDLLEIQLWSSEEVLEKIEDNVKAILDHLATLEGKWNALFKLKNRDLFADVFEEVKKYPYIDFNDEDIVNLLMELEDYRKKLINKVQGWDKPGEFHDVFELLGSSGATMLIGLVYLAMQDETERFVNREITLNEAVDNVMKEFDRADMDAREELGEGLLENTVLSRNDFKNLVYNYIKTEARRLRSERKRGVEEIIKDIKSGEDKYYSYEHFNVSNLLDDESVINDTIEEMMLLYGISKEEASYVLQTLAHDGNLQ